MNRTRERVWWSRRSLTSGGRIPLTMACASAHSAPIASGARNRETIPRTVAKKSRTRQRRKRLGVRKASAVAQTPSWMQARLAIAGKTRTALKWAALHGIREDTVRKRLRRGWPLRRAVMQRPSSEPAWMRKRLAIDGKTKTAIEWIELHGILEDTVQARLKRGWSVRRAVMSRPISKPAWMRRRLTMDGEARTIIEWSRLHGVREDAVRKRLGRGWPLRRAVMSRPFSEPSWMRKRITIGGETRAVIEWIRLHDVHEDTVRKRLSRGWPLRRAVMQLVISRTH
jgi:hypothetical protein